MTLRILLVDDEVDMAELMKSSLESLGYEVLLEYDGLSGLNTARKENPDLIILDVMLPNMDGYKVCRLLKYDDKYNSIPIILFSALGQESDISLGKEVGADAYFVKPVNHDEFVKKIKDLLQGKEPSS